MAHCALNINLNYLFSRGHATLHLAVSVGPSVGPSVPFLNCERFSHYRSCQTVRDWIAVYPALLFSYGKVSHLIGLIEASNEIDRVNKFDNSLSFGAKQNALRQIFFAL